MSINAEVFDHPSAGVYYCLLQHDDLYEVNVFNPRGIVETRHLGQLWPKGELQYLERHKFGAHLRIEDIPKNVRDEVVQLVLKTMNHE